MLTLQLLISCLCLYPAVMRSLRTIKPCCTFPSPLKLRILRKTPLGPHLMLRVRPPTQTTHRLVATRNRGSLRLTEARPRRRLALPPLNCRGCQVTVSEWSAPKETTSGLGVMVSFSVLTAGNKILSWKGNYSILKSDFFNECHLSIIRLICWCLVQMLLLKWSLNMLGLCFSRYRFTGTGWGICVTSMGNTTFLLLRLILLKTSLIYPSSVFLFRGAPPSGCKRGWKVQEEDSRPSQGLQR